MSKSVFGNIKGCENYIYMPQNTTFDFLPERSPLKRGQKTTAKEKKKLLKENSYTLTFRVVRVRIGEEGSKDEYETLITNLSDKEFSNDELKMLYFKRWSTETAYRELKHHSNLLYIHAKRTDFVIAEVYTAILLHNMAATAALKAIEICEEKDRQMEEELKKLGLDEDIFMMRRRRLKILPDEAYGLNHSKATTAIVRFLRIEEETVEALIEELVRNPVPVKYERSFDRKLRPRGFIGFTYRAA